MGMGIVRSAGWAGLVLGVGLNLGMSLGMGLLIGTEKSARAELPEKTISLRSANGRITKKEKGLLEVKTPSGVLRFEGEDSLETLPSNAKVGDQVSVWYTNESGKLKLQRAGLAKSGKSGKARSRQEPGTKGKEIIDDRAFYSASRSGRG